MNIKGVGTSTTAPGTNPGATTSFKLLPWVEVPGNTAFVVHADAGYQFTDSEAIFPLQPGQAFHIKIPLPKLSAFTGSDGGALRVRSILAQLKIERIKPALIGTFDFNGIGLPAGTIEESWVGGEGGAKDLKQVGFTWTTAVSYSGGGELEIEFFQGTFGPEDAVNTYQYLPATIHLQRTIIAFA